MLPVALTLIGAIPFIKLVKVRVPADVAICMGPEVAKRNVGPAIPLMTVVLVPAAVPDAAVQATPYGAPELAVRT